MQKKREKNWFTVIIVYISIENRVSLLAALSSEKDLALPAEAERKAASGDSTPMAAASFGWPEAAADLSLFSSE
jgi:hypothetical protein